MDLKNMFSSASQEEESCIPKLSFQQRMLGFAICCILGYVLQIFSFGSLVAVALGRPIKFAVLYSLGNVLSLAATGFLLGFRKQMRNMADKDRRITSIIFIGALFCTLMSALVFQSSILVILFLVIQVPAYIWYCATYIPFARDCLKSCLKRIGKKVASSVSSGQK